jgi:predicted membrane metal-binding protein
MSGAVSFLGLLCIMLGSWEAAWSLRDRPPQRRAVSRVVVGASLAAASWWCSHRLL